MTNAQWKAFCEANDRKLPVFWGLDKFRCGDDWLDHPVVGVSHSGATSYAEWAGSLGMLCFYSAIKEADLSRVMPIAFTAPLFGALLGVVLGGEVLTVKTVLGMALTVGGIVLLTTG